MTDTAREAAIERVRALAEGAMQPHEWGYRDPVVGGFVEDRTPFDLADHVLRLFLSVGGGGRHLAQRAAARETHPDTPSQPSALREASCSFCGRREGEVVALMFGPRVDLAICDQCAQVAACEGDGQKSAAITDPRQPSGGPATCSGPETVEAVLAEIIPPGHRCGPVETTAEQGARLWAAIEAADAAQAARMPDDKAALDQMFDAFSRLRKLGWKEAIYCPKDGSTFEVIEAGSTGIFDCHYEGEWPKGSWWTHDAGDLWPSRPILFRLKGSGTSMGIPIDPQKASQAPNDPPGKARAKRSRPNTKGHPEQKDQS